MMKVAVFAVQYTVKDLGWGRVPIPPELRSKLRIPFFHELVKRAREEKVDLVVLPGGFFRTNFPGGIANRLRHYPPKISVLVGRDNVKCNNQEAWVIAPNGTINRRVPEAWISSTKFSENILRNTERRFQINNKWYSVYCCGDVIIDDRKFTYSKAAFVLAHHSSSGRFFTPSMRRLEISTFLSHHVKYLYNTVSYAYNGKYKKNKPQPIKKIYGEFQGLKWIARIYSI